MGRAHGVSRISPIPTNAFSLDLAHSGYWSVFTSLAIAKPGPTASHQIHKTVKFCIMAVMAGTAQVRSSGCTA